LRLRLLLLRILERAPGSEVAEGLIVIDHMIEWMFRCLLHHPPVLSELIPSIIISTVNPSCSNAIQLLLLGHSISHVHKLIVHILLLLVERVTKSPKLLRMRNITLHLSLRVISLLSLEHFQLLRRIFDPSLDHVDLVAH